MNDKNLNWNYSYLLPNGKEDFAEKRKAIRQETDKFIKKYKDNREYLENPSKLKEALDEYNNLDMYYAGGAGEWYYYWLKNSVDQTNSEIKSKLNKVNDFAMEIGNDLSFFDLSLAKIDTAKQQEFVNSPLLKDYRHFLERLFVRAKHLLTEGEEKIMSLKSVSSYDNWIDMTSKFLAKEERVVLFGDGREEKKNFSEIISLTSDTDKKTRDSAVKEFDIILNKHSDVAEVELNSVLQDKKVNDQIRGYFLPEESRILSDDMDIDSVNTIVREVTSRFDIPKRYYELKAKLFGVDKLEYHERNVPYGRIEKKYEFGEAYELVHSSLNILDKRFGDIMKYFLEGGFYDVYPAKGKMSGAFCMNFLKSLPTYILLNHTDKLNDVLTLAHETGHGINNELMREKQNAINFMTFTSTAEVASTFMEDFVLQKLLVDADNELRLTLLMQKLNDDISTIFRQVALYNFERDLHNAYREKGYLTKEEIGEMFSKHMRSYMGESVIYSEGSKNWWIYWSHIRYLFYAYTYASGLLISKSLQNMVHEDPKSIEKVIEFLSTGGSLSPRDTFMKMDIDITSSEFWQKGLKEIDDLLVETITLARQLGKIQ